jgi:hypothetical protein
MKRGDIVEIFEDPITCEKSEGMAKLVRLDIREEDQEYWQVRFLDDSPKSPTHGRWIKRG